MCDHPVREAAMVVLERDEDGTPTVWCDPCIADVVRALNAAGRRTVWSCCGHGRRPATIGLDGGYRVFVAREDDARRIDPLFPDINAPCE